MLAGKRGALLLSPDRQDGEFCTILLILHESGWACVHTCPMNSGLCPYAGSHCRFRRALTRSLFGMLVTVVVTGAPGSAAARVPRAVATATATSSETASAGWVWPVDPPWQIVRGFEAPPTPYAAGHRGIDVAATTGGDVYAPAAGVVSFAGTVVDRPVLSMTLPGGIVASIEPVSTTVNVGDTVRQGERVGTVATGGHCSGRCVHFGVRLHGGYVSPLLYLARVPRAVLLPLPPDTG